MLCIIMFFSMKKARILRVSFDYEMKGNKWTCNIKKYIHAAVIACYCSSVLVPRSFDENHYSRSSNAYGTIIPFETTSQCFYHWFAITKNLSQNIVICC